MSELFRLEPRPMGPETVQTVDARELHAFLAVGRDFTTWIRDRIEQYGFIEGQDFSPVLGKSSGGRPGTEYAISLDMAKELAMVERNEQGKRARAYFIECERKAKQAGQLAIPQTLPEALRLAADLADKVEQQQKQLEAQKPAVEYLERYVEAKSTKSLREVAKVLGIKERDFMAQLVADGILFRQSGYLLPFATYQHRGLFEVKTGEVNGHAYHQTRFTPAGIAWIAKRLIEATA